MTCQPNTRLRIWQPTGILHTLPSLFLGTLAAALCDSIAFPVAKYGRGGLILLFLVIWLGAAVGFVVMGVVFRSVLTAGAHTRPGARLVPRYAVILMGSLFYARVQIVAGIEVFAVASLVGWEPQHGVGGLPGVAFWTALVVTTFAHVMVELPRMRTHATGR